MAWTFGRGRRPGRTPDAGASTLVDGLQRAHEDRFTGALEITARASGDHARIFLFDGGVYSVVLSGYRADPVTRLLTAGLITVGDATRLRQDRDPERSALEQGLIGIEAVATVHQELVLASVGAVVRAEPDGVARQEGAQSATACTVPLAVPDVLAAVELRAHRLAATWDAVCPDCTPGGAVLTRSVSVPPPASGLPEQQALAEALDGHRTLDQVAGALGLTRAEAVHLAASLVSTGAAECDHGRAPGPSAGQSPGLWVPEAFGEAEPGSVAALAAVVDAEGQLPMDQEVEALLAELDEAQRAHAEAEARVAEIAARLARVRSGMRPRT